MTNKVYVLISHKGKKQNSYSVVAPNLKTAEKMVKLKSMPDRIELFSMWNSVKSHNDNLLDSTDNTPNDFSMILKDKKQINKIWGEN